jgi:hypothetical protein
MRLFALLLTAVLTCLAANKVSVVRTGSQGRWKLTVSGSLPPQVITRIATMGDVTVRGKRSKEIRYTVTQEVVAADEKSVRQLGQFYLGQFDPGQFDPGQFHRMQAGDGQIAFFQAGSVALEIPRATRFLALSSSAGTIDAADLEGSLLADAGAGKVILDRIGGDVEIHSNGGAASLGSIGGLVKCYSGGGSIRAIHIDGQAYFETDGGDIHLGEVVGAVTALTAAGGIRIEEAGAGVFADTLGGPISVLRALGMVIANSSGGPISIGGAPSVQCRNAGGAIRLTNVSGSLRAATERGNIVAVILEGRPLEDSFLSTGAGDITVFIPSNMGVTIEAESGEAPGRRPIVSDFSGLKIAARRSSLGGPGVVATGSINGGGPRLRLKGSGGRIEIRRK